MSIIVVYRYRYLVSYQVSYRYPHTGILIPV
jgi:hypothetical protein